MKFPFFQTSLQSCPRLTFLPGVGVRRGPYPPPIDRRGWVLVKRQGKGHSRDQRRVVSRVQVGSRPVSWSPTKERVIDPCSVGDRDPFSGSQTHHFTPSVPEQFRGGFENRTDGN